MELPNFPRHQWALYLLLGAGSFVLGGLLIAGVYLMITLSAATQSAAERTVPKAPFYPLESNTTAAPVTPTLPLTDEERINLQEERLRFMVCEPKDAVVRVGDHLMYHDDLADKAYSPSVVTVKRCLEDTSFCGNPSLGHATGPCQPDPEAIKPQPFTVYYYEGTKKIFEEVDVPEHTACMCPDGS